MAGINTRHCAAAPITFCFKHPYSEEKFTYERRPMLTGQGLLGGSKAYGIGAGVAVFAMAAYVSAPPVGLMNTTILPNPGRWPILATTSNKVTMTYRFIGYYP